MLTYKNKPTKTLFYSTYVATNNYNLKTTTNSMGQSAPNLG